MTIMEGGVSVRDRERKEIKKVRPKYICKGGDKVCGQHISDQEDSVCCDLCEDWFHPKCQGFSVEAFRALSEYNFTWLCRRCKPNLMNVLKMVKKLESQVEAIEQKLMSALKDKETKADCSKQLEEKIVQSCSTLTTPR